jgi:hypothetical protein
VSKYARQIFQAMRPVFTDLGSELQRSLGFYNNSNPDTKIVRIIALGGGTKLRGLLKYLQQTLQIPVERPDSFKRLGMGPEISPAKFHENVCDFGIVYGLALQGLGIARIESNLLPRNIARSMAWTSKGKYFIAAACMLLAASIFCFGRTGLDKMNYTKNNQIRQKTESILNTVQQAKEKLREIKSESAGYEATIEKELEPFKYREMIPYLHEVIISALPNEKNNPEQAELYKAFANGNVKGIKDFDRKDRKQIFITSMSAYFSSDLATAQFGGADLWRRSRGTLEAGGEGYDELYGGYEMMPGMEMDPRYQYAPGMFGVGGEAAEEKMPGFVVTITGYSPYGENEVELGELMDPPGVEGQQDKWGFVTRLLHLDDFVVDGNSLFEVYEKTDPNQFKLDIEPVDWEIQMPAGIGIRDFRYKPTPGGSRQKESVEWVLIDPMTREIISKVAEWDENGRAKLDRMGTQVFTFNDHWFVLNVKFEWRDAPESVRAKAPELPPYMRGRTIPGTTASPKTSGSTTGGKDLTLGIE